MTNEEFAIAKPKKLIEDSKISQTRYFFREWCFSYGWRGLGRLEGYETLEELKKDCAFYIKDSDNWKILKAEVIEEKKLSL